jgi:hypothetical protein
LNSEFNLELSGERGLELNGAAGGLKGACPSRVFPSPGDFSPERSVGSKNYDGGW